MPWSDSVHRLRHQLGLFAVTTCERLVNVQLKRQRVWGAPARTTLGRLGALTVTALLLASCASDAPQDTLAPEGPIARDIYNVLRYPALIAVAIGVIVYAMIFWCIVKYRRKHEDEVPVQVHGNTVGEILWTAAPAVLLAVVGVFSVQALQKVAEEPENAYEIAVIGHQWWWEQRYPMPGEEKLEIRLGVIDDPADLAAAEEENREPKKLANQVVHSAVQGGPEQPVVVSANELVIPAERNVRLTISSHDVMHNYWVPKLNGKIYSIPGKLNKLTLRADADDIGKTFYGQCAEYCGTSHANMRFKVKVLSQADFGTWLLNQTKTVADPAEGTKAAEGMALFAANCSSCHYVDPSKPTEAAGKIGPNLAHVGGRAHFAGAIAPMKPQYLKQWLENPQEFKPGSKMVIGELSDEQIEQLIAYIQHLK
jgi:cytochrome c oxidase subunit II